MSKKTRKRPTEVSWDSDDDLLKDDTFSKTKADDEDIDEDVLLGISTDKSSVLYEIEGNEDIGEGDMFQILDPDVSAFDESADLGLDSSQADQEVLDYEDTVQEEAMEDTGGMGGTSINDRQTGVKKEIVPVQAPAFSIKREESDSDEDKGDHRERFKSERKMISLKSTKYSKPIPETLEVTPEMQEEINKFEKVPAKQRLGLKQGNQVQPQNQRQIQGQFAPRFPGNQNIRGGPRMNNNQRQQNFRNRQLMPQRGQFRPRSAAQQQRAQRPPFPHEMNMAQDQTANQSQPHHPPESLLGPRPQMMQEPRPEPLLGPRPQMMQEPRPLLGPRPQMMQEPRPLLENPPRPNIHVNPQFRGIIPMPEPFTSQPHQFDQGQPFHPPPHSQPNNFPRQAWPPHHPSPVPQGYPPRQPSQPPFSGPQPPYPPTSMGFNPRPGAPQPLIPTSGPPGPQPQHPNMVPQQPPVSAGQNFRPPFLHPHGGGPPGPVQHGPGFQPQRFGAPEPRQGFNQAAPDLHVQFRPMGPQEQRPPSSVQQGIPIRPQVGQQSVPQSGQIRSQGRQIRPQVGVKRPLGVFARNRGKLTGVGRGQSGHLQQQRLKPPIDARQKLQTTRLVKLPQKTQGFIPKANQITVSPTEVPQGNAITVLNSRGVKRRSTENPTTVPVKQVKTEQPDASMEPVDPELQRALDEQRRQREAIKAKKEQNRLALANKRRKELVEKLAKQGMTIEQFKAAQQAQSQTTEQQGQKISVLGKQYPSASSSQTVSQFTNIIQVQTTDVGSGQSAPMKVAGRGQNLQAQGVGRGQRGGRVLRGRGLARGQNVKTPVQQVAVGQQQKQQVQNAKQAVPAKVQKMQQTPQKKQNVPQGQVVKGQVKPLTVVRTDSKGGVLQTYNALPTKDVHGKTVFKLKVQDPGVQARTVQASNTTSNRTVVAGSGRGGQGHTGRQVVAHGNASEQQPTRTVVASGHPRTIKFGTNPHLRSRKVSVEGLTSTTQEAKLLGMVKNVGGTCEEIKIIPQQRRAILTFQNIDMATKFVKKYNRSMVDLSHIQVKEVPE